MIFVDASTLSGLQEALNEGKADGMSDDDLLNAIRDELIVYYRSPDGRRALMNTHHRNKSTMAVVGEIMQGVRVMLDAVNARAIETL